MSRNTNAYAARKLAGGDPFPHARAWHPTSPAEIKVFVGILIYMGGHHITSVEDLWRRDGKVPSHLPSQYMSRVRFEQIQRFLKVSDPREDDERKRSNSKEWWYKVELMANCFQEAAARYYQPGSWLAVDEIMVRCFGRTNHSYRMPHKPIKQGYKIFALAERGYVFAIAWTSKLWGIMELFKYPGLSPTASMVLNLITKLPRLPTRAEGSEKRGPEVNYSIYMDNFFTSIPLFKELHHIGCGACGTARQKASFIPKALAELKEHSRNIDWGTAFFVLKDDVLCWAWQDNNIVLGLTTMHTPDTVLTLPRKRPAETSTNGHIVRPVFGDEVIKELGIPKFIDDYNQHMGGVDIANQLRASYESHRKKLRIWFPLFYFFLDVSIVNAYRMHRIWLEQTEGSTAAERTSQKEFRIDLYCRLFQFGTKKNDLPPQRLDRTRNHRRFHDGKLVVCAWCKHKGTKVRGRVPRSTSGCEECGKVSLCLKSKCWEEFHGLQ